MNNLTQRLKDLSLHMRRGISPKYVEVDGTVVLNQKCVRNQTVDFNQARLTSPLTKIPSEKLLQPGDILVNSTGTGTVGRTALFRGSDLPTTVDSHLTIVRPNPGLIDPEYLGYFLGWREPIIEGMAKGATNQVELSVVSLGELEVVVRPVALQRRIGRMLSNYDDLIENNRRRMALLGDAMRQLYREWFVRLRFPGHEHTPITNGVPEGWETHILHDLCRIGRGASPRPIAAFMGGEVPWFKIGDATASESPFIFRTQEHVTDAGAKKSIMLQPGALILSNSATCGIPYFTAVAGCVHDGWLHFSEFKRISRQFLYCFLWFKREELVSSVGDGSTQKNLNTAAVGRLKVALPRNDSLLTHFDEAVARVLAMVLNLATQNQSLRAARDLLLPRLMSGEMAV